MSNAHSRCPSLSSLMPDSRWPGKKMDLLKSCQLLKETAMIFRRSHILDVLDIFSRLVVVEDDAHLSLSLVGLRKQAVDVFKRQPFRFGVDEVDDGNPSGVEDL